MYPYHISPLQYETVNPQTININSKEPLDPVRNFIKPDKKLLEMITMGISEATQAAAFYRLFMDMIKSPNDCGLIRNTYLDELKHCKLLQEIYYIATGENPPICTQPSVVLSDSILENIQKALFDSMENADFYRELYFSFLSLEIRDMLFEILTDKQDHSMKYNYLYSKYK